MIISHLNLSILKTELANPNLTLEEPPVKLDWEIKNSIKTFPNKIHKIITEANLPATVNNNQNGSSVVIIPYKEVFDEEYNIESKFKRFMHYLIKDYYKKLNFKHLKLSLSTDLEEKQIINFLNFTASEIDIANTVTLKSSKQHNLIMELQYKDE